VAVSSQSGIKPARGSLLRSWKLSKTSLVHMSVISDQYREDTLPTCEGYPDDI
jgi:hypothetical protein